MIASYSSIYTLGHRATADFSRMAVDIEEKIDGSQFSFGIVAGELQCRSKGAAINIDAPEKMFAAAVETARDCFFGAAEGCVYRCEFLRSPKHNTLAYSRIPQKHLIVFDIDQAIESPMAYADKRTVAEILGLETVPLLYSGALADAPIGDIMESESILGGCKIEGIVIKPHEHVWGQDKKRVLAKLVSAEFKEKHSVEWKKINPTTADVIESIIVSLRTDARWNKAIQHLTEAGAIEGSPRDIGPLLKEVQADVLRECEDHIKDALYRYAKPNVLRGVIRGFPEWYKAKLAEQVLGA